MASENGESGNGAELLEKQSIVCNLKGLSYPTRIINNNIDGILRNKILQGIYHEYGHYLTTGTGRLISEEEFVYLFSGVVKSQSNYNPPYYWNADVDIFAGLIRLLYDGQPKGFNDIILLPSDVGVGKSSIKWSGRKQGLGKNSCSDIE